MLATDGAADRKADQDKEGITVPGSNFPDEFKVGSIRRAVAAGAVCGAFWIETLGAYPFINDYPVGGHYFHLGSSHIKGFLAQGCQVGFQSFFGDIISILFLVIKGLLIQKKSVNYY